MFEVRCSIVPNAHEHMKHYFYQGPKTKIKSRYRCFTSDGSGGLSITDLYIFSISAENASEAGALFGLRNEKM